MVIALDSNEGCLGDHFFLNDLTWQCLDETARKKGKIEKKREIEECDSTNV